MTRPARNFLIAAFAQSDAAIEELQRLRLSNQHDEPERKGLTNRLRSIRGLIGKALKSKSARA